MLKSVKHNKDRDVINIYASKNSKNMKETLEIQKRIEESNILNSIQDTCSGQI